MEIFKSTNINFESRWLTVQATLQDILRLEPVSTKTWQDLLTWISHIYVTDRQGYDQFQGELRGETLKCIKESHDRILSLEDDDSAFLQSYLSEWEQFSKQVKGLSKSMKLILRNVSDDRPLVIFMLDRWTDLALKNLGIQLQNSLTRLMLAERSGASINSRLVLRLRESFVSLWEEKEDAPKLYKELYEAAYVDAMEKFYEIDAPQYLAENGLIEYMKYVDEKLKQEEQLAAMYIAAANGDKSVSTLMNTAQSLLVGYSKDVVLADCRLCIKDKNRDRLRQIVDFMDQAPSGLTPILNELEEYLSTLGLADMVAVAGTVAADCNKYVQKLLEIFENLSQYSRELFGDDCRVSSARDKAFARIISDKTLFQQGVPPNVKSRGRNTPPEHKSAEHLANYSELLLRKNSVSKQMNDDKVEANISSLLFILKYLEDKDLFCRYYKAHLRRRLILEKSANSKWEAKVIEGFKAIGLPVSYTENFERMLLDIRISTDFNHQLKNGFEKGDAEDCVAEGSALLQVARDAPAINVKVLTSGKWLDLNPSPVTLPAEVQECMVDIEEHYLANHSGRKMTWNHHISTAVITFENEVGCYDLELSAHQMAVLFAWNEKPKGKVTFDTLQNVTNLSTEELRRTLWSLTSNPRNKYQLLLNSQKDAVKAQDLLDSTEFWVNQKFGVEKKGKFQKRGKLCMIGRF